MKAPQTGADGLLMSYLNLDDGRLLAVIDGLNRILDSGLDPEDVATIGASVAQRLTGASGAAIAFMAEDGMRRVQFEDFAAAGQNLTVSLEREGRDVGEIAVSRRGGQFTEEDREILRLIAEGLASQLENACLHTLTARESRVDLLTGLGNGLEFEERLGWELSRTHRYGEQLSIVIFRIDRFVPLQDRFGPEGVDGIVVEVADVLARGRAADSCFRTASDRFALIMPNTSRGGAEIAAIRAAWNVANLRDADGTITVSAGVTQAEIPDPRAVIASAESALRDTASPLFPV